jgi:hypothetical protein
MLNEQQEQQEQPEQGAVQQEAGQPAGAENTDNTVPYSRFAAVNKTMREYEQRLADMEQEQKEQREKVLTEQQRYQELAEQRGQELEALRGTAQRAEELEKALQDTVDARIEAVPENMRTLIPTFGTPQDTLEWLDANQALLTQSKPKAPKLDGGAGQPEIEEEIELTGGEQTLLDAAGQYGFDLDATRVAKRRKRK